MILDHTFLGQFCFFKMQFMGMLILFPGLCPTWAATWAPQHAWPCARGERQARSSSIRAGILGPWVLGTGARGGRWHVGLLLIVDPLPWLWRLSGVKKSVTLPRVSDKWIHPEHVTHGPLSDTCRYSNTASLKLSQWVSSNFHSIRSILVRTCLSVSKIIVEIPVS